jgi:hypothetical protein
MTGQSIANQSQKEKWPHRHGGQRKICDGALYSAESRRAGVAINTMLETANMHTHNPIALLGDSLWLNQSGPDRGHWYDHERGLGGTLVDPIAR